TLAPHPAADDLLGDSLRRQVAPEGVGVGGVEEVDTGFGGAVEDGAGGGLVDLQPESHGSKAQARYLQAGFAQSDVFHDWHATAGRASHRDGVAPIPSVVPFRLTRRSWRPRRQREAPRAG